jgi:hypothetical protein
MPDTSTERVQRHRYHKDGWHENCSYQRCQARRDLEYQAEETLFVKEVFKVLKKMGIKPKDFWGNGLNDARAIAGRQLPDWVVEYVWGDGLLIPLRAKHEVEQAIIEEIASGRPRPEGA